MLTNPLQTLPLNTLSPELLMLFKGSLDASNATLHSPRRYKVWNYCTLLNALLSNDISLKNYLELMFNSFKANSPTGDEAEDGMERLSY